jgi:environmental stress-induced protein Ves
LDGIFWVTKTLEFCAKAPAVVDPLPTMPHPLSPMQTEAILHMTWHIKPLTEAPAIPWKNGGGLTRELVAWPNAQLWSWRMSVAEISRSGPFSQFDGVERWFAVLVGAGVRLDVGKDPNAGAHNLTPDATPLCFAGDLPADCTLVNGAAQAFNLMLRHGSAKGRMVRVAGHCSLNVDDSKMIAIYAISTGANVHFDHECLNLPPRTLAWRECPAGSKVQVQAAQALLMEIAC